MGRRPLSCSSINFAFGIPHTQKPRLYLCRPSALLGVTGVTSWLLNRYGVVRTGTPSKLWNANMVYPLPNMVQTIVMAGVMWQPNEADQGWTAYTRLCWTSTPGKFEHRKRIVTMPNSTRVVWAGTFDEELYRLITIFASHNLEERTQLVSLYRPAVGSCLTVCIPKLLPQAWTLRKVDFSWGGYSRNPVRCHCQGRGRCYAYRC